MAGYLKTAAVVVAVMILVNKIPQLKSIVNA